MIYIGIDPGVSGGLAAVVEGGHVLHYTRMPDSDRDLFAWLSELVSVYSSVEGSPRAVIERVSSSPQMGVVSAFTFGKGYGALRMALTAREIPFDETSPKMWQRAMGVIYPSGARDTEKKNISKRRAQQLFPSVTITHAIADALLIAEFCRRHQRGWLHGQEVKAHRNQQARGKAAVEGIAREIRRQVDKGVGAVYEGVDLARGQDATAFVRPAQPGAARHGAGPKRPARQPLRSHR